MSLTDKLSELITKYMSRPGHVSDVPAAADFVTSGLRAAMSANMIGRNKILSDVSDVLDCRSEDLEFLFSDFTKPGTQTSNYEIMVPDFQTRLLSVAE